MFFAGLAEAGVVKIPGIDSDLCSVAVSPFDSSEVFAGSRDSVFKSVDGGKNFKRVFVVKGEYKSVNSIMFFNGSQRPELLIATDSGLYLSRETGKIIRKLFRKQNAEGDYIRCLSVLRQYPYVYLGTDNGLYSADVRTYDFQPVSSISQDSKVNDIRILPSNAVAAVSSSGVYLKNSSSSEFRRVFVVNSPETSSGEEETLRNVPQCIYSDDKRGRVYLGTSSGLFVSKDSGNNYIPVNISGLSGLSIRRIVGTGLPYQVYLAGNQGLYKADFSAGKLESVYRGMESQDIRDIALAGKDSLFTATSKGLYKISAGGSSQEASKSSNRLTAYFKNEPSYMDVQESALKVNEVHPDQIKKWRERLKYRALFPTLRLDYDKSVYGTAGTSTYDGKSYVGPMDWGVSLSWDMGDLIWNNYEDDIDTRSRLKTQTRLEILDDIRRIYFEREKLEIELANNPPDSPDKLLEKQLYLKELTAALDGYTNGYFSRRLKELKANGE